MDKVFDISFSKMATFHRCKRKYFYNYIKKIERKYSTPSLSKGSIGHIALDKWDWNLQKSFSIIIDECFNLRKTLKEQGLKESSFFEDLEDTQENLINSFIDYYRTYEPWKKIVCSEQEHTVDTELEGIPVRIYTKFDKVVQNFKNETFWVVDHKFESKPNDINSLTLNNQFSLYYLIGRHLKDDFGFSIKGVINDQIMPAKKTLELTQKGLVKKISKPDIRLLERTAQAHNLSLSDPAITRVYEIEDLPDSTQLKRHIITYDSHEVKYFYNELVETVKSMVAHEKAESFPMTWDSYECRECTFKELCCASKLGHELLPILEQKFKNKETEKEEEIEE